MEKIKQSRLASFLVVLFVYLIATAVGILAYRALNFSWWLNLLIADVIATVLVFIFSIIFSNASVYDPYWSVQPIVIIALLVIGREITVLGIFMICAISLWGVRLTLNWAYTFKGLCHQDWRYTMLRETTKKFYPIINFVGIHMVPTLIVYACTLPTAYVIVNHIEGDAFSILPLLLCLLAASLQAVSDIQMHVYRKNKTTPFIRTGLWKYSRHPNYLGEILMWWGIGISLVVAMPSQWYLLLGALANTVLFLSVSIPMADKRQSKKEGFFEYKAQTRMLLPIKKRMK